MKRFKNLAGILVIVMSSFLLIKSVSAQTREEALKILDSLSTKKISDSLYEADLPIVDPNIVLNKGKCNYTKEALIEKYSYLKNQFETMTEDEINEYIENEKNFCINSLYEGTIYTYLKSIGYDYVTHEFSVTNLSDEIELNVSCGNTCNLSRKYKINYKTDYDKKIYEDSSNIADTIKDDYLLYGLNTINSIYHYGTEENNIKNQNYVLYRYPELREIMEKHKDYNMNIVLQGAGGTPWVRGNHAYIGIFKDGVLYRTVETGFSLNFIIFVDKDLEGTPLQKAQKRIAEYFDNNVEVIIENQNYFECDSNNCMPNDEINKLLGKTEGKYTGYYSTMTLNGAQQEVLAVEVDKKYLDNVETKASDKKSGVSIETNSYDVPIDATINVEDVTDNYIEKTFENKNIKISGAYNIDLIKTGLNTKINSIKNGVYVYLPIKNGKVGDSINVYYIKDDGTIGETIEGEVVLVNNELYAKYKTNHFSTYAVEEIINNENDINNPQTFDGIIVWIVLELISISGIAVAIVYRKKSN